MLPLAGIKVVEFCQVLAGPFCAMLLADMGAEVIKIEPPDGDGLRQWPPISDGYSENFASLNRNKKSVVLDLKNPAHAAVARRLVARLRRGGREQPARRDGPPRPRLRRARAGQARAGLLLDLAPTARPARARPKAAST